LRHRLLTRLFWTVLLLSLILRLLPAIIHWDTPQAFLDEDSQEYLAAAQGLDQTYSMHPSEEGMWRGLWRVPGYPAFLALFLPLEHALGWAVLVQALLATATVALVFQGARSLSAPESRPQAALLAGLLLALDSVSFLYAGYLLTETLFTTLLAAAMALWLSRRTAGGAALAGACLGLSALVRPVLLYFPVFLLALPLLERPRRPLSHYVLLVLLLLLPVSGWLARNWAVTGQPVFTTVQGLNLLYFRAAATLAEVEGVPEQQVRNRLMAEARQRAGTDEPAALSRVMGSMGVRILLEHPGATAKTTLRAVAAMAAGPGRVPLGRLLLGRDSAPWWMTAPAVAWLALLYAGAAAGLWLAWRQGSLRLLAPLLLTLGYLLLVSTGAEAYSRFRVPMAPLLAMLAGPGWAGLALLRRPKSPPVFRHLQPTS
jgi:hypothetical protein